MVLSTTVGFLLCDIDGVSHDNIAIPSWIWQLATNQMVLLIHLKEDKIS